MISMILFSVNQERIFSFQSLLFYGTIILKFIFQFYSLFWILFFICFSSSLLCFIYALFLNTCPYLTFREDFLIPNLLYLKIQNNVCFYLKLKFQTKILLWRFHEIPTILYQEYDTEKVSNYFTSMITMYIIKFTFYLWFSHFR